MRVAAVITAYDISPSQIEQFFQDLKLFLPKVSPAKDSDREWADLDQVMNENEKSNWTKVMKVLKDLELRLEKES